MPLSNVVFAYSRFSSAAQADGDTVRRQTALREDWLRRHPEMKLDNTLSLVDPGVSGFKGDHRKKGGNALARFVEAVERGRVPKGATLLVESVDRLSREHPEEAVPFMLSLINKGIRIVTLSPSEMVFEQGMDMGRMFMLMLESFRGHGESARKKDLCGQAWAELKRQARETGRPLGKNLHPAWVKIENGKHVLIPERAKAVRQIFELSAKGWSTTEIMRHFNKSGVPAIGRKGEWVRSYIQKVLMDRSVLGEYQPAFGSDRKVLDGEPIEGYWPAAVTPALWEMAKAGRTGRATHGRTTHRRPARMVHPFQGLLFDALDECPLYVVTLQQRKYIVSQRGFDYPRGEGQPDGTTRPTHRRPFPLDVFTDALLGEMRELKAADLFNDPAAPKIAAATAELHKAESRLRVAVEKFEADPENATWANNVDKYDRERRLLVKELADLHAEAANPLPARWQEAVEEMAKNDPARLRMALAAVIEQVRVIVLVCRGQTRLCAAQVHFYGGATRDYLIRWTRCVSLPHCRKPEVKAVSSDPLPGTKDYDLRKHDHAVRMEKVLAKLDPKSVGRPSVKPAPAKRRPAARSAK